MEAAALQPFIQQNKAVSLPVQSLNPVPPPPTEQKQRITEWVQLKLLLYQAGGDLFHVETTTVYPEEYNDLIAQARQEQDDDARPELASSVEDMDAYDTVFIGYPNWWGTMPMTMFTFLESYDFSGKTVIPFCTHEGSALGSSESDIAELIPDAELLGGLAVRGQTAQNRQDEAREAVTDWLREGGFIE